MIEERRVVLPSGTLTLQVRHADMPLDDLCGFASRRSRKRGFVFVSKVLGKHYPVRPSQMNAVYAQLAARLSTVAGPAVLIALAETATGLGQGIYEHWLRQTGRSDLFLHSTRYRLNQPVALQFEESHSHATRHLIYRPAAMTDTDFFYNAPSLVLVDDELSTGRTLANLTQAYRRLNPKLREVHIVSLTDWLDADRRTVVMEQTGVPTTFHSLLSGSFQFEENPGFDPGPIPDVTGREDAPYGFLPANFGRLGVRFPLRFDFPALASAAGVSQGERLLVLGTGEFAYPPYLLARYLENKGWDVHYQSTTRSPLLVGADLASVIEFVDNYHDDIPNYVYNVADRKYDRILIGYETRPFPKAHRLPEMLGAQALFF